MRAWIARMTEDNIDQSAIEKAGEILKNGGLAAFPTETVYGLGGNALDAKASEKIYAAKGRPSDNPLIVHIGRMEDLETVAANVPESARKLAAACWPGPLTMIFSPCRKAISLLVFLTFWKYHRRMLPPSGSFLPTTNCYHRSASLIVTVTR